MKKNWSAKEDNGFIPKKKVKISWKPFRICLLNITANPTQFDSKWAQLVMRQ